MFNFRRVFLFGIFFSCFPALFSQSPAVFRNLEKAMLTPEAVKHLSLKSFRKKPPADFLPALKNLETIELIGCGLEKFPSEICDIATLKDVNLGNNQIDTVPECICQLTSLEKLALWGNNIFSLPDCLNNLPSLKMIDMLNMQFNHDEQKNIRDRFPNINFKFSTPCTCNYE